MHNLRKWMRLVEGSDIIDTPQFQAWFQGSKAVDPHGMPLKLFHGTPYGGFDRFKSTKWHGIAGYFHSDVDFANISTGPLTPYEQDEGRPTTGGRSIYPVYLSIKHPLDLRKIDGERKLSVEQFLKLSRLDVNASPEYRKWHGYPRTNKAAEKNYIRTLREQTVWSYLASPRVIEIIKANGYDSVMYNEYGPAFIAFYPQQVKSIFNRGGFDVGDERMSENRLVECSFTSLVFSLQPKH